MNMNKAMAKAILILPVNAVIVIPGLLLWATRDTAWAGQAMSLVSARAWAALFLFAAGLGLGAWTARMFGTIGDGTPAPWDPPKKFVAAGPYRYVRNPMISGVVAMLFAEAMLFDSLALICWAVVFLAANMIYMPLFEEPGLEARFGDGYRRYKRNVPRWLPRRTPWEGQDRPPAGD